jgi:Arc/MetJ-type ribon-helix-helix transcriptional regulator
MFKQLADVVRQTLFLLRDVEQNKQDIATLKEQLAETNQLLRQLAFEFQRLSEREQSEREKHALRVENVLLRFERLLTAGPEAKKRK